MSTITKVDLKNMIIPPLEEWGLGFSEFPIIAGPCSAESEEQLIETAIALKESSKINVLRSGVWKPRTRPNNFEGHGEEALKWFVKCKEITKLPIACEVANTNHVELALKYNVDLLWIGARTTVNPFSVQEIANALKGSGIPVLVKNPINPDIALWVGAVERLYQAGINKVGGIHRGFSSFEQSIFRNVPQWSLAIELKRRIPSIKLFCDPSHIAGTREIVPMVSQKAIDLDMNGLIIESHINPSVALSDKEQQLTPKNLIQLIENELIFRHNTSKNKEFYNNLDVLREEIDAIDELMLENLGTRMKVSQEIGKYKKESKVTILQLKRWNEIVSKRKRVAKALGLREEFVTKLLKLIHEESIFQQEKIMNK